MMRQPKKPRLIPSRCFHENFLPNANKASIKVKIGVSALSRPATPLEILVCAVAYKKAGNPLPQSPMMNRGSILCQGMDLN